MSRCLSCYILFLKSNIVYIVKWNEQSFIAQQVNRLECWQKTNTDGAFKNLSRASYLPLIPHFVQLRLLCEDNFVKGKIFIPETRDVAFLLQSEELL